MDAHGPGNAHEAGSAQGPGRILPVLVADIVAAYVSRNGLKPSDLPQLISGVRDSLQEIVPEVEEIDFGIPAVPVGESVTSQHIVCLEDGKKFKSLKRHLAAHHKMSPGQYRQKWQLPDSYPMVAPSYSDNRSAIARKYGFGRQAEKAS